MPPFLTTLQCSLPGGCHPSRAGLQVPLGSCKEFPHLIMSLFPFFLDCALALYAGFFLARSVALSHPSDFIFFLKKTQLLPVFTLRGERDFDSSGNLTAPLACRPGGGNSLAACGMASAGH